MDGSTVTRPPEPADSGAGLALAALRWALLWAGWLWAGRLGATLGWDWAAGLAVPALWWAVLLAARHPVAAVRLAQVPVRLWLLLSMAAVAGTSWAGDAWLPLAVTAWALAVARLQPTGGCARRSGAGAAPALGGLGAALAVLVLPVWGAALLLGLAAWWAPRLQARHAAPGRAPAVGGSTGLPELGMGLMMGMAWLAADWCGAAGWTPGRMPALHLAWMACLPALLAGLRPWLPRPGGAPIPAALLAAAGGCALLPGATAAQLSMVLASLAWAWQVALPGRASTTLHLPPWVGPALLIATGWAAPTWGPQAWVAAQAGVGLLAAADGLASLASAAGRRDAAGGIR